MGSYEYLADAYDDLMYDVDYPAHTDFVEKLLLRAAKRPVRTLLDLACGTGTMTALLTERGYELIAADASEDMLMKAREKAGRVRGVEPLFLHQSMPQLDLNDTVDAAICCFDSLNYLTKPGDVRRTFERLKLFIAPGGALVFDVHARRKLEEMDGRAFFDEVGDVCCAWYTFFRREQVSYTVNLFTRRPDGAWDRRTEFHRQRFYRADDLAQWLEEAGFADVRVYGDCRMRRPNEDDGRIYISARRK